MPRFSFFSAASSTAIDLPSSSETRFRWEAARDSWRYEDETRSENEPSSSAKQTCNLHGRTSPGEAPYGGRYSSPFKRRDIPASAGLMAIHQQIQGQTTTPLGHAYRVLDGHACRFSGVRTKIGRTGVKSRAIAARRATEASPGEP